MIIKKERVAVATLSFFIINDYFDKQNQKSIMKKHLILTFASAFICATNIHAQSGCTDPLATNYNSAAQTNDGSCIYNTTNIPITNIQKFTSEIGETSGFIKINNDYWTLNDGGNTSQLFLVQPNDSSVTRRVWVNNSINTDWEALASDDTHLYIGDFGNNYGTRTDLKILKISIAELYTTDTVNPTTIHFNYPEQTSFNSNLNNHEYDCEAFFTKGDSLYLFTKDWVNKTTSIYSISKDTGTHNANLINTFNCDGLITDAHYNSNKNVAVLIGYKESLPNLYNSFIYLFFDFNNNDFLSGNKRRFEIGGMLNVGQTEGIYLNNNLSGHITGEAIAYAPLNINEPAKIGAFDLSSFIKEKSTHVQEIPNNKIHNIYPNPAQNTLHVSVSKKHHYQCINMLGQKLADGHITEQHNTIDISHLTTGMYMLILDHQTRYKFIKE